MLATLDLLEAYPDLYNKLPLEVQLMTDSSDNDVSQSNITEHPNVYILQNYKKSLLDKEFIDSFHNAPDYKYVCPEGSTERTRLKMIMDAVKDS